jgi:hypothetical protein
MELFCSVGVIKDSQLLWKYFIVCELLKILNYCGNILTSDSCQVSQLLWKYFDL